MNVFLLDDEQNARESLKAYLTKSSSLDNLYIKEAESIDEGLQILNKFSPDLAILDINLGQDTSFDLLSQLPEIDFKIIFVSAYDKYAVKAFKYNALDYILKPVNPSEFDEAIKKVIQNNSLVSVKQLDKLSNDLMTKRIDKLLIKDLQAMYFLDIKDIMYCKSENNYTTFCMVNQEDIVISKNLGEYEDLLDEHKFFRPHRSYLINLNQIKKYDKREGGHIQMKDGELIPLSRNKKNIFMKLVEMIHK